jgi:hypothetical protein
MPRQPPTTVGYSYTLFVANKLYFVLFALCFLARLGLRLSILSLRVERCLILCLIRCH